VAIYVCYLRVHVLSFSRRTGFHIFTQMTALCSKHCHLKDRDVN
jgi:hypothetical protein